jgi:hypothetical protein
VQAYFTFSSHRMFRCCSVIGENITARSSPIANPSGESVDPHSYDVVILVGHLHAACLNAQVFVWPFTYAPHHQPATDVAGPTATRHLLPFSQSSMLHDTTIVLPSENLIPVHVVLGTVMRLLSLGFVFVGEGLGVDEAVLALNLATRESTFV